MSSWKRKIGVVRDARLANRAKLRGAVKNQDKDIADLQGALEGCRQACEDQATYFRAAVRSVNWQRVFAEIGYAATLRCVEKYANQLYHEIESAHVAHPTPVQLRDVTDSGLVVF